MNLKLTARLRRKSYSRTLRKMQLAKVLFLTGDKEVAFLTFYFAASGNGDSPEHP